MASPAEPDSASADDRIDASALGLTDPTVDLVAAVFAEIAQRIATLAEGADGRPRLEPLTALSADALTGTRLDPIASRLRLGAVDLGLLLCAVAPTVDARFGALFAELDPGERRRAPRVDAAGQIAGGTPWDPAFRRSVGDTGALSRSHLWQIVGSGPLPERTLVVHERTVRHLLGHDETDPSIERVAATVAYVEAPEVEQIASLLLGGFWTMWVHDPSGHTGVSVACTAQAQLGVDVIALDLRHLNAGESLSEVLPAALREATLRSSGIVVGAVEIDRDGAALSTLVDAVCPVILVSEQAWDPVRSALRPALVQVVAAPFATRRVLWEQAAASAGVDASAAELDGLSTLRLGPGQIAAAAVAAVPLSIAAGQALSERHFRAAANANGAGRLERLSTHVVPRATFDDLVLPDDLLDELGSIPGWMRTRGKVRNDWGMDRGARHSRGITCLFAGPSGTGKTLAAEVLAHSLGVDLYVIDLSQIVDKYIGETEKNLDRVFSQAEGVNGVLLFDEADALFGKRTDVKSSHDRNANLEVAYLLQRMERYDGIAVLTSNLRNNIDEAFTRRLDVLCAFTEPDMPARLALWQRHLPPLVPLADDVDLAVLAEQLPITGGSIRNITIAAAHAAAIDDTAVTMRHLVVAASREYRKQGRLFTAPSMLALLD
jgi:ATPase family protein associated with various cellular activities (AAA)/winged helix domain-containing protein